LQTTKVNTAIERADREITLIQEYRARLIADTVTGKMDVRHFAQDTIEVDESEPEQWDENEELIEGQDADDLEAAEEVVHAD
jgi:type I restriction enzyme S subunit